MTYTIYASVKANGAKRVILTEGNARSTAQHFGDLAVKAGIIVDYQTAVAETLADARSLLMANFGLAFFNVARKQIATLDEAEAKKNRALEAYAA
jgi:hypothetical protein